MSEPDCSPSGLPDDRFHALAGIAYDRTKRRHVVKLTIARGKNVVGKRLVVHLPSGADRSSAIVARDAVLKFAGKLGLTVIRKPIRRKEASDG